MAQSRITDAEIVHLEKMTGLTDLTLSETALTDAAVETLAKLKSLTRLTMTQTEVSPAGFTRLSENLPQCSIRSN